MEMGVKKRTLSAGEKYKLAHEIKKRRCIWERKTRNYQAATQAWKEIASEMLAPVEVCRNVWTKMRESRRYHLKLARKNATNNDPLTESSYVSEWEYADAMSFLPYNSTKTIDSASEIFYHDESTSVSNDDSHSQIASPKLQAADDKVIPVEATTTTTTQTDLPLTINKYLEGQMAMMNGQKFKHVEKYMYIEKLLMQLPDDKADDVIFDCIVRIRDEVKKFKKNQ